VEQGKEMKAIENRTLETSDPKGGAAKGSEKIFERNASRKKS